MAKIRASMILLVVVAGWVPEVPGQERPPVLSLGSVSVDVLEFRPKFSSQDAYTIRGQTRRFTEERVRMPRASTHIQFDETWGISGSIFSFGSSTQTLNEVNGSASAGISSLQPFPGFVIRSPDTFRFLDQLPRRTLNENPSRLLPPFPFRSAIDAGLADTLAFQRSSSMTGGQMSFTRAFVVGGARTLAGVGVQHASFRQSYGARRSNPGGTRFIPGYDPFVSIDDDADSTVLEDFATLEYTSSYSGTGPRGSLDVEVPIGRMFTLFGSVRGGVLLGKRKETATYFAQQRFRITDQDQNPPAQLNFSSPLDLLNHRERNLSVPTGEVEVGVSVRLWDGVVAPFLKVSAFSQHWVNVGNITDPGANVSLQGFSASFGMDF